jgi:hypothetical protein
LKGLHENTVSCYLNPIVLIIISLVVVIKGEVGDTWEMAKKCGWIEIALFAFIGWFSVFL